MTTTNYFKKFGKAANLAHDLFSIQKALEAAKAQETKDAFLEVWKKLFEECEWRKAYVTDEYWVGTKVWRLIENCARPERKFRFLTIDEIFFDNEISPFLSLLDELNITEFVFADNSTACLDNLTAFIYNGWKVAGVVEQTINRYGAPRKFSGLLIKKAKKN